MIKPLDGTIPIVMAERLIEVVVDEVLGKSGVSGLDVEIYVDGEREVGMAFQRKASPQQISDHLNEMGSLIKYGETAELTDEERQRIGDLHIEASSNGPGL
jgi:hypothetical protein